MEKEMARRIKMYMDVLGMSQADLAEAVGVGTSSVSNWVTGKKIPRMDKIDAMCNLFGCRRSDLLDPQTPAPKDPEISYSVKRKDLYDLLVEIEELPAESQQFVIDSAHRLAEYQKRMSELYGQIAKED